MCIEGGDLPWTGAGVLVNSANDEVSLDGLEVEPAKERIIAWLESKGLGTGATTYRLRDWLFSRQRYWGEPFPIVYDDSGHAIALPESMLPVDLPEVPDFSPRTFEPDDAASEPEPPLGRVEDWVNVELDLGDGLKKYRRETNTMPNWAGSSWYEIRYVDPHNDQAIADPINERYWLGPRGEGDPGGTDLYVGGQEHAVLHLLYARFWHKVLFDLGHVSSSEPFRKLFNQGYIQAYAYADERGSYVPAADVVEEADGTWTHNGKPVNREYGKMGKSLKNVVTPDEMYEAYGADTFRVYEMSMGPLDVSRPWETRAVVGAQRFLQRVWRLVVDEESGAAIGLRRTRVRRSAEGIAQDHRRGPHGDGRHAVQHRDRQADRADEPRDQGRHATPRGHRAARPDVGAVRAAHRRGAVEPPRSSGVAGLPPLPDRRPGLPGRRVGDVRRPGSGQGPGAPRGVASRLRGGADRFGSR